MFSNGMVAFLFAVGVSGWIYAKTMRTTGNNTKNALTVAGIVAVIAFIFMLLLLDMVF